MKLKLLFIVLFYTGFIFSQSEVYYFKDSNSNLTYKSIQKQEFIPLEKEILEKRSNATFWFKVPSNEVDSTYIFRINSIRAQNAKAYQNLKEVNKLEHERYVSFKFSRKAPLYVKVSSNYSSYFNIQLNNEDAFLYQEKIQLIINGFYYGVAFLVIFFSFFYYYFFKDRAFVYYSLLLASATLSFVISDGMFDFFNVDGKNIELLILINYAFLAISSSKFASSFLLLKNYFPKTKKAADIVVINIILLVVSFLVFRNNELYIILNILTFSLLLIYWFLGVLLFKKNIHTKLFTFGYVILLFSGIDFFVLKNFGVSLFETNPINIKIGGFIQIITLAFAVLFREKNLRKYNFHMKNEIIKFSQEIRQLTTTEKELPVIDSIANLSIREREVFNLVVSGKSNKEIANEVNISINTVKFHVKNIYGKLNIKSRKEALTIENTLKD